MVLGSQKRVVRYDYSFDRAWDFFLIMTVVHQKAKGSKIPDASASSGMWVGLSPWLLATGVTLSLIFSSGISIWSVYRSAVRNAESATHQGLLRSVKSIALWVNPDVHAKFQTPAEEASPAYLEAISYLARAKEAADLRSTFVFVYTCVLDAEGQVRFVLDPTPAGDADGDGVDDKAHVREIYTDASATLKKVLLTGQAATDPEPYTDRWGTFLSGYAPFFSPSGQLAGVVGLDMKLEDYEVQVAKILRLSLTGFAVSGVLAFLAGGLAWKYQTRLQLSMREVVAAMRLARAGEQAKSDFLAIMSHEIRTPMNGVVGMSQLLADTELTDEQREYVNLMTFSSDALLNVINDILDFSKFESGAFRIDEVKIHLKSMTEEWERLYTPQFKEKGLDFTVEIQEKCPDSFMGDPLRIGQIVMNLLANSKKFTETGAVNLTISPDRTDQGGPALRFSVKDSGIGIAPDVQLRIFEVFSQADSSTSRRFGGSGLGLAICKRLCEFMDGRIWVESTLGRGSIFHAVVGVGPSSP